MILFLNTYLHADASYPYMRGGLPDADKVEILKYTLASYAVLPWSQIILHVELHPHYQQRWNELDHWVHSLWPDHPNLVLTGHRCTRQEHWKHLTNHLLEQPDTLVWYACNHDHVFLDYDLEAFTRVVESMEAEPRKDQACYYSHWPEFMQAAQLRGPIIQLENGVLQATWDHMDTIQIVHKELLHHWWHSRDYGAHNYLPRSDWKEVYKTEPFRCFIPPRELVRHFDGYSHLFSIGEVPPLSIPTGFWERQIKIRFGYDTPRDGWVQVNPKSRYYRAQHPTEGADLKCLLEDLPLFWRGRISEIDSAPHQDPEELKTARNQAYLTLASAHTDNWYCGGHRPDPTWLQYCQR